MSFPITAHHRGKSNKQAFMAIIHVSVHFAVSDTAPQAACSGSRLLSGDCERAVAGTISAMAIPRLLLIRQVHAHHLQSCIPLARPRLPRSLKSCFLPTKGRWVRASPHHRGGNLARGCCEQLELLRGHQGTRTCTLVGKELMGKCW